MLLPLSLLLATTATAVAQPFQPVLPGQTLRFATHLASEAALNWYWSGDRQEGSFLISTRVDSVTTDSAATRYHLRRGFEEALIYAHDSCYTAPERAAWLGTDVWQAPADRWAFRTNAGDTLHLHAGAAVDSSWAFWQAADSNDVFRATVTAQFDSTFLGVTEAVKQIRLQRWLDGSPAGHVLNGTELLLSASRGLIGAVSFRDFPRDTARFRLVGAGAAGVQNLTAPEVYDYAVGDVFHTVMSSGYSPFSSLLVKRKREVLEVSIAPIEGSPEPSPFWAADSVVVVTFLDTVSVDQYASGSTPPYDTAYTYVATTEVTYPRRLYASLPSGSMVYTMVDTSGGYHLLQSRGVYQATHASGRRMKDISSEFMRHELGVDEVCWYSTLDFQTHYRCVEGVGCWESEGYIPGESSERLVYFRKGTDEWGTPLTFDIETRLPAALPYRVAVAPNPWADVLRLSTPTEEPLTFILFDLTGRRLRTATLRGALELPRADLPAGVYLYTLTDARGRSQRGKLVVR